MKRLVLFLAITWPLGAWFVLTLSLETMRLVMGATLAIALFVVWAIGVRESIRSLRK